VGGYRGNELGVRERYQKKKKKFSKAVKRGIGSTSVCMNGHAHAHVASIQWTSERSWPKPRKFDER
jgi:hypothetical protein